MITIGIIGIVVALTIPSLMSNYRKHVTETRLKHFYSTINQAIHRAETDYGDLTQWELFTQDYKYDDYKAWLDKYLLPYINVLKVENCYGDFPCVYFSNGSMAAIGYDFFEFFPYAESKTRIRGKDCFSFIFAPVNINTPRAAGKGVEPYIGSYFSGDNSYKLYNNSVYGCNSRTISCLRNEGNLNKYCTRIIQENGWQIPQNYPIKF